MTLRIEAHGNLNRDTFDSAATFIDDDKPDLIVDLRKCIFFDPFAIVMLVTIINQRSRADFPVRLFLPGKSPSTYLARMRFFEFIPDGVKMNRTPPVVTEWPSRLVELCPLNMSEGEYGIDRLCSFVWPQLPPSLRTEFVEALAEIGANVIFHSEAEIGYLAAQRFENSFQGRRAPRVQFVVGDAGIGIQESLSRARPDIIGQPDEVAIEEALKEGVTSKPETHSGVGLSTVRRYTDIFDGVLHIRSGRGSIMRRRRQQVRSSVPGLKGTIVAVELSSPGGGR